MRVAFACLTDCQRPRLRIAPRALASLAVLPRADRRLVGPPSSRHLHYRAFAQMGLANQGAMILGLDVLASPSSEADADGAAGKLVLSAGGRRLWVCA